ncbi:MAG: hypothetical protein QXS54_09905 [Candidatus Methanomethylicaceae archaeon]
MREIGTLSSREMQVVNAVLTSKSVREVAEKTGLHEATIYRYLKKPAVVNALQERKRELTNAVLRYFLQLGQKALNNIEELLNSSSERIRLEASKYVLDTLLRINELNELEQRISALEQAVQEGGERSWA